MDLEEFNIFDGCDELFDINDVELHVEQTDDKECDNTFKFSGDDDFLQSLNSLETNKPECAPISVIKYGDSERINISDKTDVNENSDDDIFHPTIILFLHSLIISNFTFNMADICSIAINPITQAICFISNKEETKFRLDIHINGIANYERIGRLIQMQLRRNIRKWIIPVRRVIDKDNIEICLDPTNGEIFRTDMILATVSAHETFCNLEAMDAMFDELKSVSSDFFFNLVNIDIKLRVPIVMNYKSSRYQYDIPMQLTLREFTIIMRNKLSIEILSGYFEYRYADNGIIGIEDEEDWENFKEVMKKSGSYNITGRIEMWVGKYEIK
ncbi:hypothetical protein C1645_803772 [Glomus cerebriforme]|uniref:Uncharacterized protein n=1 Tax=Glomus cerebriforme TaxID=658196 RepID=A0A397TC15_9GLOM|nr:hypothetical protein C1645_803772 [Glomus cerebriforme]